MNEPHPSVLEIDGQAHRLRGILADGTLSLNLRYAPVAADGPDQVVKISRMTGAAGWLLWPFLLYLSWREYRIYQRLAGIDGIPALGPRLSATAFVHEFVPGETLATAHRNGQLTAGFFDQLARLLHDIHERRVFYGDLDKRDNILVGCDGRPYLFDFQASFSFRPPEGLWGRFTNRWLPYLQREDFYHLYKHKRRFQPEQLSEEEYWRSQRSGFSQSWKRYVMKPWKQARAMLTGKRRKKSAEDKRWKANSRNNAP